VISVRTKVVKLIAKRNLALPSTAETLARSKQMNKLFSRFMNDESGATAIEYGLIASLIAVAAIVAMDQVGAGLKTTFTKVSDELK
jgi:pilus assembly protein Flp/PilA